MAYYTIKELETISGVKAHTIRIWEQRYELLNPERTDTNIRRYTDSDFKKLLNVVSLMNFGLKISKLGEMSNAEIEESLNKELLQADAKSAHESWINAMIVSMVNFDQEAFETLFNQLSMKYGLREVFINVIYPFLTKVGFLWLSEGLMPAQEHFVSSLIRQKLFAAIDDISPNPKNKEVFVLFLQQDENHDIPLLFSSWIIQSYGYKVIFLGQRVPFDNIKTTVETVKATHLLTFFVAGSNSTKIQKQLDKLTTEFPDLQLYYSGNYALMEGLKPAKNAHWLKDVRDLENKL